MYSERVHTEQAENESGLSAARILLVDDNPKNIQVVANILSFHKYEVEYAMNGRDALEWLSKDHFDLVLLDVMMPEMDGFEVCQIIKRNRHFGDIPVIFLTARYDPDSVKKGFDCGAVDYIIKPFNPVEIVSRVTTHIELKRNREQLSNLARWLEDQVNQRTQELQVANQKLSKAMREIEMLDQAKTEFLNILSHEIRTPLNGIIGPLELIKNDMAGDNVPVLMHVLDESVRRLEKFSYKALEISNLQVKGKEFLHTSRIVMPELMENSLSSLSGHIAEQRLAIAIFPSETPFVIEGDVSLITETFTIAIGNAIKYSPVGGTIIIENKIENDRCTYVITDEGKGFPQLVLDKAFRPFVIGEAHIDLNMGLDLYFSKLVMLAHGGDVRIRNTENGGAQVILEFPFTRVESVEA